MSFDTFSIAAIAGELRQTLVGGRVQRVTQVNSLTYGLEIFVHPSRHYLILSAEPQAPRLHLSHQKVRRGTGHETPLMLVLRKYMHGARLTAIEQPPYERLLLLSFISPVGDTLLAAELLGTRSNLILIEPDQTILGVARLTKPATARRVLLPGQLYQPPPPQLKLAPTELNELTLRQELNEASPELGLARLLTETVNGVSPLLAREIVYRATGSTDTKLNQLSSLPPLLAAFRQLFEYLWQGQWQPTLALDEEGTPLAFAPYPLTHWPHTQPSDTLSAAIETFFADAASGYAVAKAPLAQAINDARQKLARRRERLAEDAAAQANPTALKEKGEAILAFAHQIEPGQKELVVSFSEVYSLQKGHDTPLAIDLDPALTASENAQQYFSRYRKALRAADEIPVQLEKIALEENYLEQLEQDLAMAEDRPEIDAVAEELAAAGYRPLTRREKRQNKKSASRYLRLTAPAGATVWVGKNALQNAHLTFSRAAPDDLWLHARGVPGAHVIIPTAQGLPAEEDVFWAAAVAAYYSRARHDTSVEVDVTLKKYVRAIKGAAPGLVTHRNESTLRVVPAAPELDN